MKINAINIPKEFNGLEPKRISGFGSTVILAGPNGAGKTRILHLIRHFASESLNPKELSEKHHEVESIIQTIAVVERQIQEKRELQAPEQDPDVLNLQSQIESLHTRLQELKEQLAADTVIERHPRGRPLAVSYSVEQTRLDDWKQITQQEVDNRAVNIEAEFRLDSVSRTGISAIRTLINEYIYAQHSGTAAEAYKLNERVEKLKELVQELLGAELSWTHRGDPTLFGRPVAEAGLSPGQSVLLQIALSLFFQDGNKSDLILLMDEPEQHLHPQAAITIIDEIKRKCPQAQLWIATHYLHILAHFDPNDIWFAKNSSIEHSGPNSLNVLNSLAGGERGIEELSRFISLPAQHALLNFASQCLLPPRVADTEAGDPQTSQIFGVLDQEFMRDVPVKILDFGIGKGRLLTELMERSRKMGANFAERFDYFGVDICASNEDQSICIQRLSEVYDRADTHYFSSMTDLANGVNDNSIDLIVICNTLHEIPPEEWTMHFGESGSLTALLKDSGFLLVVEDHLLPIGERAHDYGYLVLDAPELRLLTETSNEDESFRTFKCDNPRYSERLKAHLIPAPAVRRVNARSRERALERLKHRSLEEARHIRTRELDYRTGRA